MTENQFADVMDLFPVSLIAKGQAVHMEAGVKALQRRYSSPGEGPYAQLFVPSIR
jgi:hypothetical protein